MSMNNENFLAYVAEKKLWASDESQLVKVASANLEDLDVDDFYNFRPAAKVENGQAEIHIQGLLTNGLPKIYEKAGMVTSYDSIRDEIDAVIEEGASAITFRINSGGGSVNGAIELSRYIASLPIQTASVITSCACSAAYMIASATNRIAASETAIVGNIGVILSWYDYTGFFKSMGIEPKAITSDGAELKSTFHLEPNAEQLAFLQEGVNQTGETFRQFVSSQRSVNAEVFRAGWYSGNQALELGLADEIISEKIVDIATASSKSPDMNLFASKKDLEAAQSNIELLNADIATLQADLQTANATITDFTSTIANLEIELASANHKATEAEAKIIELTGSLETAEASASKKAVEMVADLGAGDPIPAVNESAKESIRDQYAKITDPQARQAFRLKHWDALTNN